jgi:hypothetical protein
VQRALDNAVLPVLVILIVAVATGHLSLWWALLIAFAAIIVLGVTDVGVRSDARASVRRNRIRRNAR